MCKTTRRTVIPSRKRTRDGRGGAVRGTSAGVHGAAAGNLGDAELAEPGQRVTPGKPDRGDNGGAKVTGRGGWWWLPWGGQGLCLKGRVVNSPALRATRSPLRLLVSCGSCVRPERGCVPVALCTDAGIRIPQHCHVLGKTASSQRLSQALTGRKTSLSS